MSASSSSSQTPDILKSRFFSCFFWAAALGLFFFQSHHVPLWSSDEGRFGEIAREMLELRNFIVPQFNYLDYLEKPILAPLLTALAFSIAGVSSFSTRLPVIFSALAGIAVVWAFTKRLLDGRTAKIAVCLLLTSFSYFVVGRFAVIDTIMNLWLSATLFCLLTACLRQKRGFYYGAYVFMALGFLTKGLIAIALPAIIFFAFLVWTGNLKEILKMKLIPGTLIVTAGVLPWCLAVFKREPEFFQIFIMQQQFSRFVGHNLFGRSRPFWFFFAILPVVCAPWILFIPAALQNLFKSEPGPKRDIVKFLICWVVTIVLFFSIPRAKLPYYLLPAVIPTVLLVALFLSEQIGRAGKDTLLEKAAWRILIGVFCTAFLLCGVSVFFVTQENLASIRGMLIFGIPLFGAGAASLFFFHRRQSHGKALASVIAVFYGALLLTGWGLRAMSPVESTYDFARKILPLMKQEDTVVIFSSPDHFSDLPFHLKRRITIAGSDRGTLQAESTEETHAEGIEKWFMGENELISALNEKKNHVFCLMEDDGLEDLKQKGLKDYRVLHASFGRVLISNF